VKGRTRPGRDARDRSEAARPRDLRDEAAPLKPLGTTGGELGPILAMAQDRAPQLPNHCGLALRHPWRPL